MSSIKPVTIYAKSKLAHQILPANAVKRMNKNLCPTCGHKIDPKKMNSLKHEFVLLFDQLWKAIRISKEPAMPRCILGGNAMTEKNVPAVVGPITAIAACARTSEPIINIENAQNVKINIFNSPQTENMKSTWFSDPWA